ncbi:MAG: hypothetical protein U7M05_12390 [Candidatus Igneacidithiobacillus chanchocoensis]
MPAPRPADSWAAAVRRWFAEHGLSAGRIILTQGPSKGHPGGTNRLEILCLDHPIESSTERG